MSQFISDDSPVNSPLVLEDANPAMQATHYARTLLALIHAVLSGRLDVSEFREAFGDFYVEHQPDLRISVAQAELFAAVQQKIDWTDSDPSVKAQQNGWRNHAQFMLWLRQRVAP